MTFEKECLITITIGTLILCFCAGMLVVRQSDLKHEIELLEMDIRSFEARLGVTTNEQ